MADHPGKGQSHPHGQRKGWIAAQGKPPDGNFEYCDRFASDTLDIRWMFLRNPSDFYTLDGKGLTLHAKPVNISQKESPSAIFARRSTTRLQPRRRWHSRPAPQRTGRFHLVTKRGIQFRVRKDVGGGKPALTLTRSEKETVRISTVFLDEKEAAAPVKLKICGKGRYYDFYYSTGGDWTLMARGVDAINLSTNRSAASSVPASACTPRRTIL